MTSAKPFARSLPDSPPIACNVRIVQAITSLLPDARIHDCSFCRPYRSRTSVGYLGQEAAGRPSTIRAPLPYYKTLEIRCCDSPGESSAVRRLHSG